MYVMNLAIFNGDQTYELLISFRREHEYHSRFCLTGTTVYKFSNAQESLGQYVSLFQYKGYNSPNEVY